MSNLIPCPSCNGKIDKSAMTCPHCGKKLRTSLLAKLLIVVLLFIIIPFIFWLIIKGYILSAVFREYLFSGGEETQLPKEEQLSSEVVEPLAEPIFLSLESFVVNLNGGRQFLKTTIQLMLSEPAASAYLAANIIEVKEIVLGELQELSVEDVKKSDAREALRKRLISAISQILPINPEWSDPNPIRKVLIEEFQLQ